MGQLWKITNNSKREQIQSFPSKLMEWCYFGNPNTTILCNLLANEWKGDEIFVVGDYTERKYQGINYDKASNSWLNRYDESVRSFTKPFRYVYNHALREFIDFKRCREDEWGLTIQPLPLLLAGLENGDGLGDYTYKNRQFVGRWRNTSQSLEITTELLPLENKGYNEIIPDFFEEWDEEKTPKNALFATISNGISNG